MAGPSRLDKPKCSKKAVQLLAGGATQGKVARTIGVSPSTVSRWTKRSDVKGWIEEEAQKYIESLPNALAISKNLLEAGRSESRKLLGKKAGDVDHKILEMATREAESMRKSVGITPAQHQSILVQNIYNDHDNSISPAVRELLSRHLNNILDITPEPIGEHRNGDDEDG